ncbi:MAG: conjugal transfer protein TraG N-terminal domain-containing protein [Cellvibrionaceae bacterium]|nr:conjugal transfer protein TraG N-terminal domain-containing protein [Cellvibrionaceae bacterium]
MDFTIYSIGDSAFLEQVMISLALLGGYAEFAAMVKVGLLVGVLSVFLSALAKGGKEIEIGHVVLGYLLWATMFVPTARVIIEDSYTGYTTAVEGVPIGPAAAGGIISTVGYRITKMFEVAYGPIVPKATETEFAESLSILSKIRNNSHGPGLWLGMNSDAGGGFVDLQTSWTHYIKDCTLKKIDLEIMTPDALITGPFLESLEFDSRLFGTLVFTNAANPSGENMTCTEAWDDLQSKTNFTGTETVNAFNASLDLNSSNLPAGESAVTKTADGLGALVEGAITATNYMKLAVLEPILLAAASGKYNDLQDQSAAIMINQAMQQRNTQWAAEQTLFMSIVRPMLAFFEAFTYAVTPMMAFVMVLGSKGIQLAGKYFLMVIWIQLWMPILSIINLYLHTVASRDLSAYEDMGPHNWDSFYALSAGADTMQHWVATGGLLASATPIIALMLVYGSAMTATNLAGRLKGQGMIDDKYNTPDLTNTPPALQKASPNTWDQAGGTMVSGEQMQSLSFDSRAMEGISSSLAKSHGMTKKLGESISSDITQGANQEINYARAQSMDKALQASGNEGYKAVSDTTTSVMDTLGIDKQHESAVRSAMTATLGGELKGGVKGSFSPARMLQSFMNRLDKLGISGDGSSTGFFAGAEIKGRGEMSMGSTAADAKASAVKKALSQGLSNMARKTDEAGLSRSIASGFNENNAYADTKTWGNSASSKLAEDYNKTTSDIQGYQQVANQSESFGLGGSIPLNIAGNKLQQSPEFGGLKKYAAEKAATNPAFAAAFNESLRTNTGRVGDEDQAMAMALLQTMTNPASYGANSHDADNGMLKAFNAYAGSQGNAQAQQLGSASQNENIDEQGFGPTSNLTPATKELKDAQNNLGTSRPNTAPTTTNEEWDKKVQKAYDDPEDGFRPKTVAAGEQNNQDAQAQADAVRKVVQERQED